MNYFNNLFICISGYNKDLKILEDKIEKNVRDLKSNKQSQQENQTKLKQYDVVAVFVEDWQKWIRASIKNTEEDGYCVWAIDYGLPMFLKQNNIVKLPNSFSGYNLKNKRIHRGGISNCVPAIITGYDIASECSITTPQSDWSKEAIKTAQNVLNAAVKITFEQVKEYSILKKSHFFGRLMFITKTGTTMNLVKCLMQINQACLTENNLQAVFKTINTLHQKECYSKTGEILTSKNFVAPINLPTTTLIPDNISDNITIVNDCEDAETVDLDEDNKFFDESASMFHSMNRLAIEDVQPTAMPNYSNTPDSVQVNPDTTTHSDGGKGECSIRSKQHDLSHDSRRVSTTTQSDRPQIKRSNSTSSNELSNKKTPNKAQHSGDQRPNRLSNNHNYHRRRFNQQQRDVNWSNRRNNPNNTQQGPSHGRNQLWQSQEFGSPEFNAQCGKSEPSLGTFQETPPQRMYNNSAVRNIMSMPPKQPNGGKIDKQFLNGHRK